MDSVFERASTPNTVMYYNEDDLQHLGKKANSRPGTGNLGPPPAPNYRSPLPDRSEDVHSVGGRIWTIQDSQDEDEDDYTIITQDEEKILLEKEFDDYYEERVYKSAGPVVFISKMLGMIPVIWTEDDSDGDCKSYFNLYTFLLFLSKQSFYTFMQFLGNPNFLKNFLRYGIWQISFPRSRVSNSSPSLLAFCTSFLWPDATKGEASSDTKE